MKNFFFILSFLSIGLAACTGCNKKDTSTPVCTGADCIQATVPVVVPSTPDDDVVPTTSTDSSDYKTLSGSGWELTVPQEWEKVTLEDEEVQPALIVTNQSEHNIILLAKDAFPGTTPEYVLEALKGFKEVGAKVDSSKQVELNGNNFVFLNTSKDGARIWFWISVKDGFGYALSCGGPASEVHHEAICNDVAKSLKLN